MREATDQEVREMEIASLRRINPFEAIGRQLAPWMTLDAWGMNRRLARSALRRRLLGTASAEIVLAAQGDLQLRRRPNWRLSK